MTKQVKKFIITSTAPLSGRKNVSAPMTIEEAVAYYAYTLECGASYQHERGNKKINLKPSSIKSLITNLNNASNNSASNGCGAYYIAEDASE